MIDGPTFWWYLSTACLIWFSTVTVYVAVRGGLDIKHMLRRLRSDQSDERSDGSNRQ
jgi:hypothetical protein